MELEAGGQLRKGKEELREDVKFFFCFFFEDLHREVEPWKTTFNELSFNRLSNQDFMFLKTSSF